MELLLEGAPGAQVHSGPVNTSERKAAAELRLDSPAPAVSARMYGLDLARCMGCLGVIWFHVVNPPYNGLGYFRMPFFTAMLAYLMALGVWKKSGKSKSIGEFTLGRAKRLLLPYVACVMAYKVMGGVFHGHTPLPLNLDMVMTGWGSTPLWYLPFAFAASVAAYLLARMLDAMHGKARVPCLVVLAIGGAAASFLCKYSDESVNWWSMWAPLIGTIPLGVGIAFLQGSGQWRILLGHTWWAFAILWCGFAMLAHAPRPDYPNWMGILSGLCLVLAGIGMPLQRFGAMWKYLANLTFGMYLAHAGILNSLSIAGIMTHGSGVPRFFAVTVLSMLVSAAVMHFRFGRMLLGMEPLSKWRKVGKIRSGAMPAAMAA